MPGTSCLALRLWRAGLDGHVGSFDVPDHGYDAVGIGAGGAGLHAAADLVAHGLMTACTAMAFPTRAHSLAAQGDRMIALGFLWPAILPYPGRERSFLRAVLANALGRMVLRGLAAGDLVYGLCCPLPVKLQTPLGTV